MKIRNVVLSLAAIFSLLPCQAQSEKNPVQPLVDAALVSFKDEKFDDALKKLHEAEKQAPNSAFILNLIGAVQTKQKDYAAAKSSFEKSLAISPDFFPAVFNVGELLFLQKRYPQALEYFTKMLNSNPANELLQFKVVLCLLLTKQTDEAEHLLKRMKFPGDGPAWYYAQAALKIAQDDKGAARDFITSAHTIFPDKVTLYDETFEDLGWPSK